MSRHRFDHAAALATYLDLPADRRTYAEVARTVGVSETTIRRVARLEKWEEALAASNRRAVAKVARTREERIAKTLQLNDRLQDYFVDHFDEKAAEAGFGDFERMQKLVELLMGEATDRMSLQEVQGALVVVMRAGPELLAELAASGLKGPELERAFRERFPTVVRDRIAIGAGSDDQADGFA